MRLVPIRLVDTSGGGTETGHSGGPQPSTSPPAFLESDLACILGDNRLLGICCTEIKLVHTYVSRRVSTVALVLGAGGGWRENQVNALQYRNR